MEQTNRIEKKPLNQQWSADLLEHVWSLVWEQIPRGERGSFIKNLVKDHLGVLLSDMSREERASLMNDLLPLVAQEFPLADLDVLSAFPISEDLYGECQDESNGK